MSLERELIDQLTEFSVHSEPFKNEKAVREYFTHKNMKRLFGNGSLTSPSDQPLLDKIANRVIAERWNCNFLVEYTDAEIEERLNLIKGFVSEIEKRQQPFKTAINYNKNLGLLLVQFYHKIKKHTTIEVIVNFEEQDVLCSMSLNDVNFESEEYQDYHLWRFAIATYMKTISELSVDVLELMNFINRNLKRE